MWQKEQRRSRRNAVVGKARVRRSLSLGELEATACTALAILLTFLHAAVAGEEAAFLLARAKVDVVHGKSAAEALDNCAGLAGIAAAVDGNGNVEVAGDVGGNEGSADEVAVLGFLEVIVDFAVV